MVEVYLHGIFEERFQEKYKFSIIHEGFISEGYTSKKLLSKILEQLTFLNR